MAHFTHTHTHTQTLGPGPARLDQVAVTATMSKQLCQGGWHADLRGGGGGVMDGGLEEWLDGWRDGYKGGEDWSINP